MQISTGSLHREGKGMKEKQKWAIGVILSILAAIIVIFIVPLQLELLTGANISLKANVILLDPGHGGIDGGAEGTSGICEKDINLAIAWEIREMAEADGWKVIMTRTEDEGLYNKKEGGTIRSLKTQDLLERKRIIEDAGPLLAVSIHLNSFKQDRSVRGAQTFYPTGSGEQFVREESKRLAEMIQQNLVSGLDDGTDRAALGKKDVMLLKNPKVPIVIVECGFLSNRQDESLLQQQEYQKKLAECIYKGIMEYSGREKKPSIELIDNRV